MCFILINELVVTIDLICREFRRNNIYSIFENANLDNLKKYRTQLS